MSSSAVQTDLPMPSAPEQRELEQLDAYWRTANYLAAGMIYLQDNPLLREPCLLYTSPSPRDLSTSRMPSSA